MTWSATRGEVAAHLLTSGDTASPCTALSSRKSAEAQT
jgi:hypothetical protein